MSTRFIAELGSCHMGKLGRIKEAIHKVRDQQIWGLKLQLFQNKPQYTSVGNIWLDPEIFTEAFYYAKSQGVNLSASAFDAESALFLLTHNPKFVKLAYGKKEEGQWFENFFGETIISCDVMTDHLVSKDDTKLYCIPEYPVRYQVDFNTLFTGSPPRFNGFSDHTLGLHQTQQAIAAGAQIIEKHVRLGYADETCPDARFAVNLEDLGKLNASLIR